MHIKWCCFIKYSTWIEGFAEIRKMVNLGKSPKFAGDCIFLKKAFILLKGVFSTARGQKICQWWPDVLFFNSSNFNFSVAAIAVCSWVRCTISYDVFEPIFDAHVTYLILPHRLSCAVVCFEPDVSEVKVLGVAPSSKCCYFLVHNLAEKKIVCGKPAYD